MRLSAFIALFALVAVAWPSVAEEPTDTRVHWVYEGGWFAKSKDGSWYELNEVTQRKVGKPLMFKEVKRTKESIELYDDDRKISVRLFEETSEVKLPGKDWEKLYKGRWKALDE